MSDESRDGIHMVEPSMPSESCRLVQNVRAACNPSGTILVVDDEPIVCHITGRMLEQHGFTVLCAQNAAEALHLATEARHIDLLLTDVVMPEMSGPRLAQELRSQRPNLLVLFTSGLVSYGNFKDVHGWSWMLRKPYTATALVMEVWHLLAASDPHASDPQAFSMPER